MAFAYWSNARCQSWQERHVQPIEASRQSPKGLSASDACQYIRGFELRIANALVGEAEHSFLNDAVRRLPLSEFDPLIDRDVPESLDLSSRRPPNYQGIDLCCVAKAEMLRERIGTETAAAVHVLVD